MATDIKDYTSELSRELSKVRGTFSKIDEFQEGIEKKLKAGVVYTKEQTKAHAAHINVLEQANARTKTLNNTITDGMKRMSSLAAEVANAVGDSGKQLMGIATSLKGASESGNAYLLAVTAIVEYAKLGINRFVSLQKAAEDYRYTSGLSIDQSREQTALVEELNRKYQEMGVSLKEGYDASLGLFDTIGNQQIVDNLDDLTKSSALMVKNIGVAANVSAPFFYKIMSLGNLTEKAAIGMTGYADKMAKASGIPLPKLMKSVATASSETLAMSRGNVLELIKAAAAAQRLGLNLNDVGKSARGLLNFQESVTAEMEASVLTGKAINLQMARVKAYNNDMPGALEEVLNQVEGIGDAWEKNVFAQEAIARATGLNVQQLQTAIQNRKRMNSLTYAQKAELKEMERIDKSRAELTDDEWMKQKRMQSTISDIQFRWQKILNILADRILPHVESVFNKLEEWGPQLEWAAKAFSDIGKQLLMFSGMVKVFDIGMIFIKAGKGLLTFAGVISSIIGKANAFSNIVGGISNLFKSFNTIAKFLGPFSKIFTLFGTAGKAIPVLGEIIMLVQAAFSIFGSLARIWKEFTSEKEGKGLIFAILNAFFKLGAIGPKIIWDVIVKPLAEIGAWIVGLFSKDLGEKLKKGIESVDIFAIFTWPFRTAWNWITGLFGGKSPSKLALLIVKGIQGVTAMLFDSLIAPYKMAWDFIKGLFTEGGTNSIISFMVDSLKFLGKTLKNLVLNPIETGYNLLKNMMPSSWSAEGTTAMGEAATSPAGVIGSITAKFDEISSSVDDSADRIVNKIDELIVALKNGNIAINLDGRLVNKQLAAHQ